MSLEPHEGFLYHTPSTTLAINGNLSIFIENPASSTRTLIIERYRLANMASSFLNAIIGATYTKPSGTISIPAVPYHVGTANAPQAVVSYANATAGINNGGYVPVKSADLNETLAPPLIIDPGYGFAIQLTAVVAATVAITVYTREA